MNGWMGGSEKAQVKKWIAIFGKEIVTYLCHYLTVLPSTGQL